jgi:hypothetical protein
MTYENFVLLTQEVRRLQKKYDSSQNGNVLKEKRAKESILDNVIAQHMKPRDPQQILFESS